MYKPISYLLHSFLLLVLIGTSGSIVYYLKTAPSLPPAETVLPTRTPSATPAATLTSTLAPTPVPGPSATGKLTPDAQRAGWSLLQPGLERRVIQVYNDQLQPVESVYIWRLDQKYFRLDVAYAEQPKTLDAWQKE